MILKLGLKIEHMQKCQRTSKCSGVNY